MPWNTDGILLCDLSSVLQEDRYETTMSRRSVNCCLPQPPMTKKIPAYPLNPQDPASSRPDTQEVSRGRRCQYVTSAKSAKDVKDLRKLLVLGCFLAVFPKLPAVLASLTYPRASILYGGHTIVLR